MLVKNSGTCAVCGTQVAIIHHNGRKLAARHQKKLEKTMQDAIASITIETNICRGSRKPIQEDLDLGLYIMN